jgi:hypothetical protein
MSINARYAIWFIAVIAALVGVGAAREADRVLGELAIGAAVALLTALLVLFSKGAKASSMWLFALLFGGLWAGRTLIGHFVATNTASKLSIGSSEILYFLIVHAFVVCLVFVGFWLARLLNDRV